MRSIQIVKTRNFLFLRYCRLQSELLDFRRSFLESSRRSEFLLYNFAFRCHVMTCHTKILLEIRKLKKKRTGERLAQSNPLYTSSRHFIFKCNLFVKKGGCKLTVSVEVSCNYRIKECRHSIIQPTKLACVNSYSVPYNSHFPSKNGQNCTARVH